MGQPKLLELDIIKIKETSTSASTSLSPNCSFTQGGEQELNYKELPEPAKYSWLTAPETVHWAVTYNCDAGCPDCYTKRFPDIKNELDTTQVMTIIKKVAQTINSL